MAKPKRNGTNKHTTLSVTPKTFVALQARAKAEGVPIGRLIEKMLDKAEPQVAQPS